MARVPFVDLKNQYESIRGEIEEAIRQGIEQSKSMKETDRGL